MKLSTIAQEKVVEQQHRHEIEIRTVDCPIDLTIRPPGSKSITNRALLCAALADGESLLIGALDSDDTRVMIDCLRSLGIELDHEPTNKTIRVAGCGGSFPNNETSLYVENSGTTIRFLTAVLGMHGGEHRLHGVERMHQRPIGPLLESLRMLGGHVEAGSPGECPPVSIANERLTGGATTIAGSVSSQYLSGLMMAAPITGNGLSIDVSGALVSQPYVEMTRSVMSRFGIESQLKLDEQPIGVSVPANQQYRACRFPIEPDASAASYFWAAAAICGGSATVTGLDRDSIQGDIKFADCLAAMGCEVIYGDNQITVSQRAQRGIDVDMSAISDTVQTLAAVAMFVDGETRIRGVAHNRVKETDRIRDLATELRKLGAEVTEYDDGLAIIPGILRSASVETYNDHRMAMSLSLVGLRQPGVVIRNPGCTAKTYPGFFEDLSLLYSS